MAKTWQQQISTPEILKKYGLYGGGGGTKGYKISETVPPGQESQGFQLSYQIDRPYPGNPSFEVWNITPEQAKAFQGLGLPYQKQTAPYQFGGAGNINVARGALPASGYPEYIPTISTTAEKLEYGTTEITPYMRAFQAGKAAGKTPEQISQEWAAQARVAAPEKYLPPTPGKPLASLGEEAASQSEMNEILSWVGTHKENYGKTDVSWMYKSREEMIEAGVKKYGEGSRQFLVDTIYRELRSPGEPAYKPPAYDVYKGTAPTFESISAEVAALSEKATALQQKVSPEGITSELLEPSQEIDLGDTTVPKDTGGATIASAEITQKSIDDYIKMLTGDTTAAQTKETDLIARMNELLGEAGGQAAMLAEEETKAGVDTITKQLKNIQNEIAIKTAAFKQLYADIEGKPITMASIIGETARARAVEQADIGFLQAQALALQNNLSFAQQTAQKAVDTKYGPIEEELRIKAQQLELIQGQLSAKEKIRAEALKLFLADQKTAITDAKATEKQRTDYLLQQMNKYPSAGLTLQDTYETAQAKILKSVEYRQEVEKGEPGIDTEVVDDFNKEMFDWDLEGTRESFIRRLQSRFPDIDPDDIARKVYETYPDDYKQETKGEKVITSGQVLEVAKEMKLDDVENYLRATYSDDELKKLAKDAGFGAWNKSAETEVKEYLESPSAREKLAELLVKRYKESGYTIED